MFEISAAGLTATLVPACGGLIARLVWRAPDGRSIDILHAPADAQPSCAAPNRFGLWPMVPFANRAFGARIDDGVASFSLPVNDPATGSTIHGFGWQAAWEVASQAGDRAVLHHIRNSSPDMPDPYVYVATLTLTVGTSGLHCALAVENRAVRALPYGLGLHPWFAAPLDATLRLAAPRILQLGPGYRPTGIKETPAKADYAQARPLRHDAEIAWSYLNWDGRACIASADNGYAIDIAASDSLRHPVVWRPAGADFLCLEPQSHAIGAPSDAVGRAATPLQKLAPGARLEGWITIAPRLLA